MNKFSSKKISVLMMITILLFNALVFSGCNEVAEKSLSNNTPEINKKEGWTEIGKDIFVITSDFYLANMVIITSGDEAILVDTGMNEKDRKNIQKFLQDRKLNLKNIIITHMHDDHKGNLKELKTNEMTPITPDNSENNQIVKLGDKTLKIIFTEGHYKPNRHISVEVIEYNILIAGDIICNNILPPIAAGGELKDLLKTLVSLEEKNYALIVPGHGEVVENELIFKRQFEYLNNTKKLIEKMISNGGNMLELKNIKLEDCIEDTTYLYDEKPEISHQRTLRTIYFQLKK